MPGEKIDINGVGIHYEKVGNGPIKVLLLPGGMGTTRTDFEHQLESFDKSQFTLIGWDPPGYGYSRPPNREYGGQFLKRDADLAAELMRKLGYNLYSLMGWSDGAKTALLIAIKYQSVIEKAVVWGASSYVHPDEMVSFAATKDIRNWNDEIRDRFLKAYGDELQPLWARHIDEYSKIATGGMDICKDEVKKIRCPVFVLHGDVDPLIKLENPQYLLKTIPDCRLHRFPRASHNMHQQFPVEFNKLVQEFLLE